MSLSLGEAEMPALKERNLIGHMVAWNYLHAMDTPENHSFIEEWRQFTGDPAAMEDLDRRGGGAHFHLLLCELIGHAVPVVVELHVIVDVDAVGFPVAILVTCGGQGA